MKILLTRDLAPLRIDAKANIDRVIEEIRGRYVTLGPAQTMVYMEKERQAQLVSADPGINPALVPFIVVEAEAFGTSLLDAAAVILTLAEAWRQIGPLIEVKKIAAKAAVDAATSPAEIDLACVIDVTDLPAGF